MNIHELSDLDADALTITTRGTRTWVTCTSEGEEVTVGPFPTQKLTSALPHHSDDMDGGVTAALIEKEAEPTDVWRRRAEKAEDTLSLVQQQRGQATARAEQAEAERDELREKLAAAEQDRDDAPAVDYPAMWWKAERERERAERERDEAWEAVEHWQDRLRAEKARPLTPDAITAEDLRGVVRVVVIGPNGREYDRGDLYSHGARALIQDYGHTLKVFAAPPPPPEWADLADVLGDLDVSALVDTDDLARQAHARGVRVVGEAGAA